MPAQVSLVSGLLIGVPSFLLTFEPSYERIHGHFLRNVFLNALPGGLANVCTIFAVVWLGGVMGLPQDQISTACTLLIALNGFLILLFLCWPLNPFRAVLLGGIAAALMGAVLFLSPWFQLTTLTIRAGSCSACWPCPPPSCWGPSSSWEDGSNVWSAVPAPDRPHLTSFPTI